MAGPLDGIRVLDFSTLLPGPLAGLILAEAGAEVIKIERPGHGDEMRTYPPMWGLDGVNFVLLNRGKKSITIDLKDASARAALEPLLTSADVLIEQFRPGVMARLGLGYEQLVTLNPRLIYCSITGYGQTGPKRNAAGHDLNYIGDAGLLSLSMGTIDAPVVPPALIGDIAGGTYPALLNILLALRERDRTGRGSYIDIAMAEGVLPFMYWAIGNGLAASQWPGSGDGLVTGGTPRYRLYPTRDGKLVAAAPIEQRFWDVFVATIGLDLPLHDDKKNAAATTAAVRNIIVRETSEHWRGIFLKADCCCSIVASVEDALADPHFASRGVFAATVSNADGQTMTALPVPITPQFRATAETVVAAPTLGEHNREFLP